MDVESSLASRLATEHESIASLTIEQPIELPNQEISCGSMMCVSDEHISGGSQPKRQSRVHAVSTYSTSCLAPRMELCYSMGFTASSTTGELPDMGNTCWSSRKELSSRPVLASRRSNFKSADPLVHGFLRECTTDTCCEQSPAGDGSGRAEVTSLSCIGNDHEVPWQPDTFREEESDLQSYELNSAAAETRAQNAAMDLVSHSESCGKMNYEISL